MAGMTTPAAAGHFGVMCQSRLQLPGGCTCGAAVRRRCLKAAGAVRPRAPESGSGPRVRRELDGRGSGARRYRHRVPLGLLMMEQGWITAGQLKQALEAQKSGRWRAAGPFPGGAAGGERATGDAGPEPAVELPRAASGIPRRRRRFRRCCRVCSSTRSGPCRCGWRREGCCTWGLRSGSDPVLALALERMTGLRVESGLVAGLSSGRRTSACWMHAFLPVELLEASSEPALVRALARAVERVRPVESRLVRVHDCLWLRMWKKAQPGPLPEVGSVEDVIGSIGGVSVAQADRTGSMARMRRGRDRRRTARAANALFKLPPTPPIRTQRNESGNKRQG